MSLKNLQDICGKSEPGKTCRRLASTE